MTTTPLSLAKTKRRAILKRALSDTLPGYRVTARDFEVVTAVYECRALTAPQIAALFFGSEHGEVNTRCKHRLRMLYHYGYLRREEQASKLSEGRKPLVYFLDKGGANFLRESGGLDVEWDPHEFDVSYLFLQHLLSTNDVRVGFLNSARKHGFKIDKWIDDKTLKSSQMKDIVSIKGERGGRIHASVVPDAYVRLETDKDTYNFFLEVDRGTVTGKATEWGKRDWGRKVQAYLQYHRSGMYEKRYGTSDMRILTVTTGDVRLSNLKAITEDAGGKARFWFTTFDRLKEGDVLAAPLWRIASRTEIRTLI